MNTHFQRALITCLGLVLATACGGGKKSGAPGSSSSQSILTGGPELTDTVNINIQEFKADYEKRRVIPLKVGDSYLAKGLIIRTLTLATGEKRDCELDLNAEGTVKSVGEKTLMIEGQTRQKARDGRCEELNKEEDFKDTQDVAGPSADFSKGKGLQITRGQYKGRTHYLFTGQDDDGRYLRIVLDLTLTTEIPIYMKIVGKEQDMTFQEIWTEVRR